MRDSVAIGVTTGVSDRSRYRLHPDQTSAAARESESKSPDPAVEIEDRPNGIDPAADLLEEPLCSRSVGLEEARRGEEILIREGYDPIIVAN